ncbi:ABC transporter ATP-binding protein [Shinella pollutisoli]|uniref:ABC transporter ATP-binding protein n=1 Tax=Shinella pollutisoli TaxID=2250594 RepID=A0ABV7DER4_9HYPH|nr:ABC transporter ATP-binding protein [Shinella pollutisoli]
MMSGNHHIRIEGVSKAYGSFVALKGIDLSIAKGEFFSLLGPSGCGKTSLLKILGGFEAPSAGDVIIAGTRVNDVPPYRRNTNMVFQSYALFPHLDVYANIGYGLKRRKASEAEKRATIEGLIDLMQLKGLENRNVEKLSGGQKQRVALARALALKPEVLLLDEPLGALDKKLRDEMQKELRAIQQRVGITFVFVTHDQEEAMALSDRVAVLFDGRIAQVDTPRNLYNRPKSVDVAQFIGTINLFDGVLRSATGGRTTVESPDFGTISVAEPAPSTASGRLRMAVRPEQVAIEAAGAAAAPGRIAGEGTVTALSFRGDRSYVELALKTSGAPLSVVVPNVSSSQVRSLDVGTTAGFSFAAEDLLLLE